MQWYNVKLQEREDTKHVQNIELCGTVRQT